METYMKRVLITGCTGLVGSQAVDFFKEKRWEVVGIDNNGRSDFFNTPRKDAALNVDIRHEDDVRALFEGTGPFDAIIHAAAQPSHDYSKDHVLEDFDTNARGTVILLEAARKYSPNAVFVHCSTDKIYGEGMERGNIRVKNLPVGTASIEPELIEQKTRYDHPWPFDENTEIRPALSPFGVSKLAADFYVQEYAAQGWLTTGVFRMGCITGSRHEGAEMHGFLAYLAKCIREGKTYKIFGYKGKQVRDQIHSWDLVNAFYHFIQNPRNGGVYNIGGGPERSCSPLEAGTTLAELMGKTFEYEIHEARFGDRQWDVHDVSKFKKDYPEWDYHWSLMDIYRDLCQKKS